MADQEKNIKDCVLQLHGNNMIFCLQFKTPDVVDQLAMSEDNLDKAKKLMEKFIEYGEYVTLEFDTDAETCVVKS